MNVLQPNFSQKLFLSKYLLILLKRQDNSNPLIDLSELIDVKIFYLGDNSSIPRISSPSSRQRFSTIPSLE